MSRSRKLAALACSLMFLMAAGPAHPVAAPLAPPVPGSGIVNEPMVLFSLAGGTLTGTVHRQLAVYNTGFVTISKFDNQVFPTQTVVKDVQTASVSQQAVLNLWVQLIQAGAVTLPDQQLFINDVPLSTLTLLEGQELALSRTISWWVGGPYSQLDQILDAFIQTTFPGF